MHRRLRTLKPVASNTIAALFLSVHSSLGLHKRTIHLLLFVQVDHVCRPRMANSSKQSSLWEQVNLIKEKQLNSHVLSYVGATPRTWPAPDTSHVGSHAHMHEPSYAACMLRQECIQAVPRMCIRHCTSHLHAHAQGIP